MHVSKKLPLFILAGRRVLDKFVYSQLDTSASTREFFDFFTSQKHSSDCFTAMKLFYDDGRSLSTSIFYMTTTIQHRKTASVVYIVS